MIVAVSWVEVGIGAFGTYLLFAGVVAWARYERWLRRRRRTGDVEIGPACSHPSCPRRAR